MVTAAVDAILSAMMLVTNCVFCLTAVADCRIHVYTYYIYAYMCMYIYIHYVYTIGIHLQPTV